LAENYCVEHQNDESDKNIFVILLEKYLTPDDNQKPDIESVLFILEKHFEKLDLMMVFIFYFI
jgi:hypothetical protein